MNNCIICWGIPVLIAGLFGSLAGGLMQALGCTPSTAGAVSGVIGLMSAQTFHYICLLLMQRYARTLVKVGFNVG